MHELQNIRFSVWTDGKRNMCSISATVPSPKNDGMSNISFYFTDEEMKTFAETAIGTLHDISYRADILIDSVTFYHFEAPYNKSGRMSVPYYSARFPMFARKVLLRMAKRIWKNGPQDETRTEVHIDPAKFAKWDRLFTQGTGTSSLDMDDRSRQFFEECLVKDNGSFKESVDRLLVIAKNTTYNFLQHGTVKLSKDWDGFFFVILAPNGRQTMHGGVINHGSRDENDPPSWSTHT